VGRRFRKASAPFDGDADVLRTADQLGSEKRHSIKKCVHIIANDVFRGASSKIERIGEALGNPARPSEFIAIIGAAVVNSLCLEYAISPNSSGSRLARSANSPLALPRRWRGVTEL
jgi:hypothetical protein